MTMWQARLRRHHRRMFQAERSAVTGSAIRWVDDVFRKGIRSRASEGLTFAAKLDV